MNNPNVSTFLADKFIALGKYQELQKQLAEKNACIWFATRCCLAVDKRCDYM